MAAAERRKTTIPSPSVTTIAFRHHSRGGPAHERVLPALLRVELQVPAVDVGGARLHGILGRLVDSYPAAEHLQGHRRASPRPRGAAGSADDDDETGEVKMAEAR